VDQARYAIRPVRRNDVPAVVAMVHELAEYEHAPQECHLTDEQLTAALFAEQPALFGHVAIAESGDVAGRDTAESDGSPVGFALWFVNYSTWLGSHGIYLEDLYVRPSARGAGLGRELLRTLAAICVERGYPRLEWWVLHWNPARDFYRSIGAASMAEWIPYRLAADALSALGSRPLTATRPQTDDPRVADVAGA
jgi:GNAT superfamily N-acetyltransferase